MAAVDLSSLWNDRLSSLTPNSSQDAGHDIQVSLSTTAQAWRIATDFFAPRALDETSLDMNPSEEVVRAVAVLQEVDMVTDLLTWHTDQVDAAIKVLLTAEIQESTDNVPDLLLRLATYLEVWSQPHQALSGDIASTSTSVSPVVKFRRFFLSRLYPLLTSQSFFAGLQTFLKGTMSISEMSEEDQSMAVNVCRAIHYLSLFDRLESLLFGVVYQAIEDRMANTHAGDFETQSQLQSLGEWLTNDIGSHLISICELAYAGEDTDSAESQRVAQQARARIIKNLRPVMQRFEWHVYSQLFKLRCSELFDIIVDWPASEPAISDLKTCLDKTDQKAYLMRSITMQIKKRLLHPGADTKDILSQYVSLIRVMRVLDPPGLLLAKTAGPIRAYLRSRDDTIRCIVSGMIEEDSELMNELRGGPDASSEEAKQFVEKKEQDVEDYADDSYSYTPAPIDAPADFNRNKTADIIQLLVSIYDTKEQFVKELQLLLAERLLQVKDHAFEKELRTVEILKIRFGEQALSGLEVMLKDCADSKRTEQSFRNSSVNVFSNPFHAILISHLFWPEFEKSTIKLPGQLARMTEDYERAWKILKPEKKVSWIPDLGSVALEVELPDRKLDLEVTVVQAAVLECFLTKEPANMTVQQVQEELQLADAETARDALRFWKTKSVLGTLARDASQPQWQAYDQAYADEYEEWVVIDRIVPLADFEMKTDAKPSAPLPVQTLPSLSSSVPASAVAATSMQDHWPFIRNALSNLHSLPTVRLQNMLNALAPGYTGHSLSELERFMETARREGAVVRGKEGHWRLVA